MKKLLAVLFSLMLLSFVACGKDSDVIESGKTIKIGFLGPMTGDAGNYGKLMSQSVKIAIEEFNAAGGAEGFNAELIVEDTEGKVEKGNPAIEKLAGVDKVFGIVGAVFSSVSLAVAPKAEAAKIVMISPSSTHKDLPGKGKFIFRDVMSDALQAVVFGKYLAKVDNVKTVAILYVKNDYSQGLAMDFKAQYEKEGGKVVAVETALQGDKDFKTQLTKIKGANPEALYVPNYVAEIAQILEQAKQLGLKTKIYSADGFSNPQIFELAGDLSNGVIYTQAAEQPASQNKINFEAKYQAKWGEKPDAFSLNAYDGAKIILNAIKETSSKGMSGVLKVDRDKVRDFVAKTKDYDGASGKITFTADGDLVANIGIYTVENKQFKQLKMFKLDGEKLAEIK
ncbi:MAG: ABC transporter substrate-binding protein [Spirochaetae bacterium HGW-Spirochaetae-5]|nr:MAG: ABC transporter substrate-binding protein [Spirochaetae bacterium HGW-Spirochaetae-5]